METRLMETDKLCVPQQVPEQGSGPWRVSHNPQPPTKERVASCLFPLDNCRAFFSGRGCECGRCGNDVVGSCLLLLLCTR
jgi:hypothetical protein